MAAGEPLIIVVPVYNDWESLRLLLPKLDAALGGVSMPVEMLIVNDGSTEPAMEQLPAPLANLRQVRMLDMRRNLGHQRAICIALSYIHENIPSRAALVMDADGEDDPADVPKLIKRFEEERAEKIVFARRARRSESLAFRAFYSMYKIGHRLLTGHKVEVGNFSIVPAAQVRRLVVVSELWNHFAAAIYSARLPYVTIPTARAKRLAGRSKMNFVALVTHGLSAISVFSDRVGVRVLVALSILMTLIFVAIGAIVGVRVGTGLAIPGWATYTIGLLMILLVQMVMLASIYIVLVLGARQSVGFLPVRDYRYFCGELTTLGASERHG